MPKVDWKKEIIKEEKENLNGQKISTSNKNNFVPFCRKHKDEQKGKKNI